MLIHLGGLQQIGGQTVATRMEGHIYADYTCSGSPPTEDVSTYTGVRS